MQGINLTPETLKATKDLGFTEWTDIQLKSMPLIQQGKDVLGQSHTGSGKTAAFGIPIIEKTLHIKKIQALIIAPTRELSEQIKMELYKFSKYKKLNMLAIYGGVSINPQIFDLRNADIVVGTPGRLLDHMQRGTIDLKNVRTVVLDEADRMLDMGFIDDIRKILSHLPKERQMLLFSATMPSEIQDIVKRFMKNPERVKAKSYVDEGKLAQIYYTVEASDKFSLLMHLLKNEKGSLTLIFCSTRHMVDMLSRNLYSKGIFAQSLHGGLTQQKRSKALELFHNNKTSVLVASDVAARGLDVKNVSHVINYDIPKTSKEYIHRIGRTARAGMDGKVISLVSRPDYDNFRNVLSDRSLQIQKIELPKFEKVAIAHIQQQRDGPRRGNPRFSGHGRGGSSSGAPPRRNFAQRHGFGR